MTLSNKHLILYDFTVTSNEGSSSGDSFFAPSISESSAENLPTVNPPADLSTGPTIEFSVKLIIDVTPFNPNTNQVLATTEIEIEHRYTVFANVVSAASKSWQRLIQNYSKNALQGPIYLHNIDPESLRILLAILHQKHAETPLPNTVSLDQLVELVTTTQKCKAMRAVREYLDDTAQQFHDGNKFLQPGNEKFIWIAYQLGYHAKFHALAKYWQLNVSVDQNGEYVLPSGSKLSRDDEWMPPGLLGKSAVYFRFQRSRNHLTLL